MPPVLPLPELAPPDCCEPLEPPDCEPFWSVLPLWPPLWLPDEEEPLEPDWEEGMLGIEGMLCGDDDPWLPPPLGEGIEGEPLLRPEPPEELELLELLPPDDPLDPPEDPLDPLEDCGED